MNPSLGVDLSDLADRAGAIASRNGNATVAPMARRTVRRGNAFLVTNIIVLSYLSGGADPLVRRRPPGRLLAPIHTGRRGRRPQTRGSAPPDGERPHVLWKLPELLSASGTERSTRRPLLANPLYYW